MPGILYNMNTTIRVEDAAFDDLLLGRSCINANLHVIHSVAEVDELADPVLVYL